MAIKIGDEVYFKNLEIFSNIISVGRVLFEGADTSYGTLKQYFVVKTELSPIDAKVYIDNVIPTELGKRVHKLLEEQATVRAEIKAAEATLKSITNELQELS